MFSLACPWARECASQPQHTHTHTPTHACRVKSLGYAINPPRVNDSSRETVVRDMGKFTRVDDMVDAQVIAAIILNCFSVISSPHTVGAGHCSHRRRQSARHYRPHGVRRTRFPHCVFVTSCAGTLMARKSACLLRRLPRSSSPGRALWAAAAAATSLSLQQTQSLQRQNSRHFFLKSFSTFAPRFLSAVTRRRTPTS